MVFTFLYLGVVVTGAGGSGLTSCGLHVLETGAQRFKALDLGFRSFTGGFDVFVHSSSKLRRCG